MGLFANTLVEQEGRHVKSAFLFVDEACSFLIIAHFSFLHCCSFVNSDAHDEYCFSVLFVAMSPFHRISVGADGAIGCYLCQLSMKKLLVQMGILGVLLQ